MNGSRKLNQDDTSYRWMIIPYWMACGLASLPEINIEKQSGFISTRILNEKASAKGNRTIIPPLT
jgi:hypothetical protein